MLSIRAHRRVYCVAAPLVRLKEKKLLWKQNDLETECRRQRKITARWVNMTLKDFDELIQKVKRLKRLNFSEFRRSYFIQSNSLIKSTLMFNVLPGTEVSVHAEVPPTAIEVLRYTRCESSSTSSDCFENVIQTHYVYVRVWLSFLNHPVQSFSASSNTDQF